MTYSQIEKLMASLQMRPDDRPLWEIALQLAQLNETLDRITNGNYLSVRSFPQ